MKGCDVKVGGGGGFGFTGTLSSSTRFKNARLQAGQSKKIVEVEVGFAATAVPVAVAAEMVGRDVAVVDTS